MSELLTNIFTEMLLSNIASLLVELIFPVLACVLVLLSLGFIWACATIHINKSQNTKLDKQINQKTNKPFYESLRIGSKISFSQQDNQFLIHSGHRVYDAHEIKKTRVLDRVSLDGANIEYSLEIHLINGDSISLNMETIEDAVRSVVVLSLMREQDLTTPESISLKSHPLKELAL